MKATIEFDLDDVNDIQRHRACIEAEELASCIFEFANNTRREVEEYAEKAHLTPAETIDHIYDLFQDILESHHIDIYSLLEQDYNLKPR